MITIYVQGVAGLKLPKEAAPRSYITDAEPVAVEGSHYYRKAIADGDLVELSEDEWAKYQAGRDKAGAVAAKPAAKPADAAT